MTKMNSKKFASGVAGLLTAVCLACPALAATLPVVQLSNPVPGTTNIAASGTVTAKTTGNTENFNQSTGKAIIDFKSFDVGSHTGAPETVNFNNNSSTAVMMTLARIHDTDASKIYGTINDPHGVLILSNGNGIYFKNGSHVNVGGLIATTSSIGNSDFNAGNYHFTQGTNPHATVINDGTITTKLTTVQGGGLVAFLAPTVKNNGTIEAKAGQVILAGGDTATFVDLYGDGLINLATNGHVESLLIENSGSINANGGNVRLTAGTAKTVIDSLINMNGLIEADVANNAGGKVTLEADAVEMVEGHNAPATIRAHGGNIKITGFEGTKAHNVGVTLDGATIDAGNGRISITGTGYGTPTTSDVGHNYGVYIKGGTEIKTTGAGKISIAGFGGNGDGSRYWTSADRNYGVYITGSDTRVTSENGDISIFGKGGGVGAKNGSGEDYGVYMSSGALVYASDKGDISVTGFGGGCGEGCGNNYGVFLTGRDTEISSENGDIYVFGKGGGDKSSYDNYGVYVTDDAGIEAGTGDIMITGLGGGEANLWGSGAVVERNNFGIKLTDGAWVGGEERNDLDSGRITFTADTLTFDRSARVQTFGDVYFEPYHNGTTIGIAYAPGLLQLTNTVLDDVIDADSITVGNTYRDYGKITAGTYDWKTTVSILNGWGDIEIDGVNTINGNNTFFHKKDNTFRAVTAWGDIIIGEEGAVISGGDEFFKTLMIEDGGKKKHEDTLITLAASFGRFLNYGGSGAVQAPKGRWLIYSFSPVDDIFGGLSSGNTAIWGTVYDEHHGIHESGDRYVFTVCPTLTVTFDDMTKFFGTNNAAEVAVDPYTLDYTVRGLDHMQHDLLPYVGDAFYLDTVVVADRTSAGSPASAPVGAYPDIWGKVLSGAKGMHVVYKKGTLTVFSISLNDILDRSHAPGRRGPNGTLLSIVNTGLPDLAPGAGGGLADLNPKAGGDNPQALADLSPKAGGNASITPLIQCNEVTPCDINQ